MNEGATRKRDGNARREAERDEASRKREKRGRRWPEGRQRRRSERVKRVRRRNGWKANRGDQEGGEGISRADLPSCGEMADHHRRIIREPNIFSSGASLL